MKPAAPPLNRVRRLGRSGEIIRPDRAAPRTTPPVPPSGRVKKVNVSAVPPPEPARPPAPSPTTPPPVTSNILGQLWPLWILVGAVLGGGLRFLPLSPSMLPLLVGLGVALIVVIALGAMAVLQDRRAAAPPPNPQGRSRLLDPKKAVARSEAKKDPAVRLASLTNGTAKRVRRDPNAN